MASKKSVYEVQVKVDQARAQAEAKRLAAIFRAELGRISAAGSGGKGSAGQRDTAQMKADAAVRIAAARAESAERINASRAYAARGIESEKQLTTAVKTEADRRQQLARLEALVIGDASGVGRARAIENEKRFTMVFKAEIAERQRQAKLEDAANRNRGAAASGFTGAIPGAAGALVAVAALRQAAQTARQVAETAMSVSDLRTANLRAASSFQILAGSAKEADAQLRAIRSASAGTIDKLTAQQIAVQANALKLADTAQEMEQVTRAAREVTLVSATIKDTQSALTELSIFAANPKNFARADQLGLDQGSIKDRMKELMASNAGMDESTAKLQATMQLLDERYGTLLDSQAAAASGAEKLRVAWADLKAELAQTNVAGSIDEGLNQLAGVIDRGRVAFGSQDPLAQQNALEQLVKNAKWQNQGLGDFDLSGQKNLEEVQRINEQLNDSANDNVIGIDEYREAASLLIVDIAKLGNVSDETLTAFRQMGMATNSAAENNMLAAATSQTAAEAAAYQREQVEGLAGQYVEMGGEIARFAQGLVLSGASVQDFNERIAGMAEFFDKKAGVRESAVSGADELVKRFGVVEANKIIEQQLQQIEVTFQRFQREGIRGGPLLDLSISELAGSLSTQVDQIIAEADRLAGAANFDQAVDQINTALAQLNSGSLDSMDGISGLRDELVSLWDTISFTGMATDEQTQRIAYLSAVAYAATNSTSTLGQIQAILGTEFLNTNGYASGLVEQIIMLDAAQAAGRIGALEHAGGLGVLTGEIYNTANAAGVAAGPLAQLLALRNALSTANTGNINLPAFQRGQDMGTAAANRERLTAGLARREQLREQQEAIAKDAAKGFKSAASSAAKDFNSAAKATRTAFENAAKSLESALRKVEGLFSTSEVTQEDLDIAAAGGEVNKADNWRRRLEDKIKTGKDWAGVSIEQAKQALELIGVKAADTGEGVLAQINKAWNDQSLFAAKENLGLIDADVVRQQLQIQDKIKTGQQNILDMFGATVDGIMAGVAAGDKTAIGLVANELAGTDNKELQEMAKGMMAGIESDVRKALNLAVAEPVEAGGGGGGGGSLSTASERDLWDPSKYLEPLQAKIGETLGVFGDKTLSWITAASAMPLPPLPVGPIPNPKAMLGATPQAMTPAAMAAMTGPALTPDPATATNYMKALVAQFEATAGTSDAIGKTIGATIGGGMDTADLKAKAEEYLTQLDLAFDVSSKQATIGKILGSAIAGGMDTAVLTKQAEEYLTALDNTFDVSSKQFDVGKTLGVQIAGAMGTADLAGKATEYIESLAKRFGEKATDQETIGYNLATFIGFGFSDAGVGTLATDYMTALAAQFATPEVGAIPIAIGDVLAFLTDAGFNEHVRADLAAKYLTDTSKQFGAIMDNMIAIGNTNASWIANGFDDYDFSAQAAAMVADMKAAFSQDSIKSQLAGIGGGLIDGIFVEFRNRAAYSPWLAVIVDEIATQATESVAATLEESLNTTTEARSR